MGGQVVAQLQVNNSRNLFCSGFMGINFKVFFVDTYNNMRCGAFE